MTSRRLFSRKWDQPTTDQYAERWASVAKTPQSRARIRRLSRSDNFWSAVMLSGMGLFVLMIPVAIVLALWFWISGIDRPEVFMWGFGIAFGVTLFGAIPTAIVSDRLHRAQFADADTAVGIVECVTSEQERDGEGDLVIVYRVRVTARLSDQLTLIRQLEGGAGSADTPDETWIGRRIRFRHNTLDPDDLSDVRFDGWADETPRPARQDRSER
ncbi:hypothetical protein [Streptomyces sp. NPDC050560]|uniref:hypothetical protein n=1 Tax=Streptomyces sp. NPDC050560 TaxID=3365630 RepID=UPI0037A9E13E